MYYIIYLIVTIIIPRNVTINFCFLLWMTNAIYSVLSQEEYPGGISEALDLIPFRVKWFCNFPVTPSDRNGSTGHKYDL